MSDNRPFQTDDPQPVEALPADDSRSTDALHADISTLERILQMPRPEASYSDDEECQQIVRLVEQIGATPPTADDVASPDKEAPRQRLGHYDLLTKLGEGGMGAVYKALHTKLNKLVALKVLPANRLEDKQAVARFEREMRAVGQLNHTNIVAAHDAGEVDGNHYLVMELVNGLDLSTLVRSCGPLPLAEACEVIRRAAEGLQHAYESGMVHRDIKPGNLMLTFDGQVKILDMGLALLDEMNGPGKAELTTTGAMMGTLDYMAPEQGMDSHQVDIRADIYSLGATLFKLITGETPFYRLAYDNQVKKILALATETPRTLVEVRDDVPPELSSLVARMLAKQPDDRPATPQAVIDLLTPFAAGAQLYAVAQAAKEKIQSVEDAPSSDTFAHLSSSFTQTKPTAPTLRAAVTPSNRRPHWRWIAVAAGAAAALLLGAVIIIVRDRSGKEVARIKVPEAGEVEIHSNESPPRESPSKVSDEGKLQYRLATPFPVDGDVQAKKAWVVAELRRLNPGFDGNATFELEMGAIVGFTANDNLIRNIRPLEPLKHLKCVSLWGSKVVDLAPLTGMSLEELDVHECPVAEISKLKGMPLRKLQLSQTPVSDISVLEGMPLEDLNLDKTKVRDLSVLKTLNLTSLSIANLDVRDLSDVQHMKLEYLSVGDSLGLKDLSPLKGMPLKTLQIWNSGVNDLSPLQDMPLTFLNAEWCPVIELRPLAGLPLRRADFNSDLNIDYSPLAKTPIVELKCKLKPERDLEMLRQIKTLKTINGKPVAEILGPRVDEASTPNAKATSQRKWTDKTGRFQIEAKLLAVDGDAARLQRADDRKTVEIPLARLSEVDQAFAKDWKARADVGNE